MRYRRRCWLAVASATVALCAVVCGCAGSSNTTTTTTTSSATSSPPSATTTTTTSGAAGRGGQSALSVSPTSGTPKTVVRFSFTSPGARAAQASTQITQSLSIVGPRHAGCVGAHDESVPVAPAGQAVHVAVDPAQLGGAWCPGAYTARLEVLARPKCAQGMMCPQFIRVVAALGPVRFRIAG